MPTNYEEVYNDLLNEIQNQELEATIINKLASFDAGELQPDVEMRILSQDKNKINSLLTAISGSIFDYKEEVLIIQGQQEENDINQSTDGFLPTETGGSSNY
ncbi:hypothetical protein N8467_00340 [bacterium]|nr:hypothetical protein [bacterium]